LTQPAFKLDALPESSLSPELWRQLATALEYEGWQEAATLYAQVHAALAGAAAPLRAKAMMDHAAVLRRVEKGAEAASLEAEAEALLGGPIEREVGPKSSVDELRQGEAETGGLKGLFKKFFKE
jgi:hypothetical protein